MGGTAVFNMSDQVKVLWELFQKLTCGHMESGVCLLKMWYGFYMLCCYMGKDSSKPLEGCVSNSSRR